MYIGILAAANPKHRRLLQRRLERPEDIIANAKENREQLIAGFVTDRPDLPDAGERMGSAVENAEMSVEKLSKNPELYVPLTTFHLGLQKGREEILDRKWVLMTTEEPNFFIISDHPVIALPPTDDPSEWVNEYWSLTLILPISPHKALQLIERDSPGDEVAKIGAQGVALANKYSMVFAERQVYSHTTSEEIRRAFASTKKEDSDRFFID